jgi:hypothetical protein
MADLRDCHFSCFLFVLAIRVLAPCSTNSSQSNVKPKRKASTAREYQRIAKLYIRPRLGRRLLSEITRQDVARLHHELASKSYQANRRSRCFLSFSIGPKSMALGPMAPIPAVTLRNILFLSEPIGG